MTIHPVLRQSALILSLALTVVLTEHASRAVRPVEALAPAPAERERITSALAQLPLAFEPNQGQAASEVTFLTRAPGYLLQLTATEMRMIVKGTPEQPTRATPPSADPGAARLALEGADATLRENGNLDLALSNGRVLQWRAPLAYQDRGGLSEPGSPASSDSLPARVKPVDPEALMTLSRRT